MRPQLAMGFGGTNFHVVLAEVAGGRRAQDSAAAATTAPWHGADVAGLRAALVAASPKGARGAGAGGPGAARVSLPSTRPSSAELRAIAIEKLDAHPDAAAVALPRRLVPPPRASPGERRRRVRRPGQPVLGMGDETAIADPTVRAAFDRPSRLRRRRRAG